MALICSSKSFLSSVFHGNSNFLSPISVCNEVPEEPVLSPVSRHVFEKRLIVKFVQQNGSDPVNGEPLTEDDLLEIKGDCKRGNSKLVNF